jgi:hypothetical protein
LSRETGFSGPDGDHPSIGDDDVNRWRAPFLYRGPGTPGVRSPVARVLTSDLNGEAAAYPYDVLQVVVIVGALLL